MVIRKRIRVPNPEADSYRELGADIIKTEFPENFPRG